MTLLYHEDVPWFHLYNGDVLTVFGMEVQFVAVNSIIQGYQLWRSDDGRCWLSFIDGNRTEDGPYYPVLVRGDFPTGVFVLEPLRVCVYGLRHEAWRPPVLTL